MVFSEVFIRKPIMTLLVMVAIVVFGVVAYGALPISDLPTVDYPVIQITVSYPGADPSTMASTVASPLENECTQIPGLAVMISDNTEGQTKILLTFDLSKSVDLAAPDVQAAISRAMGNLPTDLPEPPTYTKTNPSDAPILYIAVTSDTLTRGQLYDFGNKTVGQQLSMINGVSQIQVFGGKTAVRVQVNPEKLASYQIGINEVAQALKNGTVTIPGGSLNGDFRTFSIQPKGQLFKASEYDELIVAYRDGAPVRLKDLGKCVEDSENDVVNVMYGKRGDKMQSGVAFVMAYRQAGANTVAVAQRIKDELNELRSQMPGAVQFDIFYDLSNSIVESVNDVKSTIVIALILVVLIIFLFMGRISDTVIPSMTLPITIIGTFIAMFAASFSLDNLSLMALTLSVGFLVDDAIVILENTVRHVEAGEKPLAASIHSMKEITGTVISTSVALVAVFLPLVFMGGVVGRNFHEFAMTVVYAIAWSTIISLMLTPMLCSRMLKEKKPGSAAQEKTKMQIFSDMFESRVKAKYAVALKWVLERKQISVFLWIACFVGTIGLFGILPKTFIPAGDSGAIEGQILMQQGASTDQIREFQFALNKLLNGDPAVDKILTATGLSPGADQSMGLFYVVLKPIKERGPIDNVVQRLRMKAAALPYGYTFMEAIPALKMSTGGESTAQGSKYSYLLSGADQDALYEDAMEFEQALHKNPIFVDVQNSVKLNMPQLDVEILRDRASTFGITAADIESALTLAYASGKVTTYKTALDQYDVILELDKKYQRKVESLNMLYIRSNTTDALVPLATVARWKESVGPQDVPHYAQQNSATISFNLKPGVPLGNATKFLNDLAFTILKPGISGQLQGEAQEFEEAVASMAVLILASIFIMYIILGMLYESYIHPFTVLTTLPVAAFGGLATLLIFRAELSLYAYIGVFMLLGIVSKNGIMMVDFANQNMEEKNMNEFDAIYDACLIRFRPILMTGASTIIGALPIALGFGADGASRRPLGLIVMGGLMFAQVITLFVTPGIFLYMQIVQDKFLDRFDLFRSGASRKHEMTA
ncbi:MAG: efflux RND transporter permease subunit [Candidatus Omnitrophota bacterium]